MKLAIGTALLFLLAASPAYTQETDKEKEKPRPARQEEPKKHESERRPPQQAQEEQQVRKQQDEQRDSQKRIEKEQADRNRGAEKQSEQAAKQQIDKDRAHQQQHVAQDRAQQQHNDPRQAQRDGGNHNVRQIREEDFHAHFGRAHHFHVQRRDDRRFNYGGYWFSYYDAWPSEWSYDDDVYIDEIDGEYYLIDPVRPGIRISVYILE